MRVPGFLWDFSSAPLKSDGFEVHVASAASVAMRGCWICRVQMIVYEVALMQVQDLQKPFLYSRQEVAWSF